MTAHPIDTEALRRLADRATPEVGQESGAWQTDGYAEYIVVDCEQDSDGEYDHIAEAANERLGAFIAAANPDAIRALLDLLAAAEAERDEWRQTALDERAAALDALEQIKVRDARIKAVRELHVPDRPLDKYPDCAECTIHGYCEDDAPVEWPCPTIRALDGDA